MRELSDQVALAVDNATPEAWENWARSAIASGAIVPPYDWKVKRIPWLGLAVLAVSGIGVVVAWLHFVRV